MPTNKNTPEARILEALYDTGVKNWNGYNEALDIVQDNLEEGDDPHDPVLVLGALESVGVDEWGGYDEAMMLFHGEEEDDFIYDDGADDHLYDPDDLDDGDDLEDDDLEDDDLEDLEDLDDLEDLEPGEEINLED